AFPIIGSRVANFGRTGADSIEDFERGHEFTCTIDADLHASATHLLHALREEFRRRAHARKVLRPGSDQLPVPGLLIATTTNGSGSAAATAGAQQQAREQGHDERGASPDA